MPEGKFYLLCVPWGQNGYYFATIIEESGRINHFCYEKSQNLAESEIKSIAIRKLNKDPDLLDNEKDAEKIQKLIKNCRDKESLKLYRFHGLYHD